MGKKFGNLQKLSGITFYRLSPYELKPFKGLLFPGIASTFRRIGENFFYMGIPFLTAYIFVTEGIKHHEKINRKNPDEYKDDV